MNVARVNDLLRISSCSKYCYNGYSNQRLADFPATFKPKAVQDGWYDVWEENQYFVAKNSQKEALRMILPPPNITGILHLGHALTVTIQDILARWYRMRGHPVIWIPGLDHAGIATQIMVEKHLYKSKGLTRVDMGKEQFVSYVWDWKNKKENTIKYQLKALGATLDWPKEYFTMSKDHSAAVTEAFVMLNERNMLYRKEQMINWSPTLQSTISDIEVEVLHLTEKTHLDVPGYTKKVTFGQIAEVAYPVKDSKDEIVVATTRPETLYGDVAIAVHPTDERYAKYIGQYVWHVLRETYIPVVADISVDPEFGTGAVKITPAHDHSDYAIAKKHHLDIISVIDEHGNMSEAGKKFKGLPRYIARDKILTELSNRRILRGIKDHKMSVPRCSRSNDIVEYFLKEQWFLKCSDMAQQAIQTVKNGDLKIIPPVHEELWYNWLGHIKDWCVSRQLWWGHRIPAYNVAVGDKSDWIVARSESDARLLAQHKYGSDETVTLHQDNDVLDTWFSSAILPFATVGWPNKEFERHYPLTLMETGHDILFFWVARMVMLGLELTGRLPFKEVLLHGIMCDAYGKKMSKTVGNVVSPENIINGSNLEDLLVEIKENHNMGVLHEKELNRTLTAFKKTFPNGIPDCGADALRMTLCSHNIKNRTISFNITDCQTHKFFGNKIWQVSKYIVLATDGKPCNRPTCLTTIDRWIFSRLSLMVQSTNDAFMQRDFHKAVASIKQFVHYEFCDFYVEATKWGFKSDNPDTISSHAYSLITCLEVSLRSIAPIMPYLADDLYKRLSTKLSGFLSLTSLLEAPYPLSKEFEIMRDTHLEENINQLLEVILETRGIIANVSKKLNPEVHIVVSDSNDYNFYNENINLIKGVCKLFNISVHLKSNYAASTNSVCSLFTTDCSIFVLAQDTSILEQVKSNISRKQTATEKESKRSQTDVPLARCV